MKVRTIVDRLQPLLATWKELQRNWIVSWAHKSVFFCFTISVLFILWRWKSLPPAVPLWYSRPWGEDQLAHPAWLFVLPLIGLLWHGVNGWLSASILHQYPVFVRVLFLSSFLINVLSLVTLMHILFLVT